MCVVQSVCAVGVILESTQSTMGWKQKTVFAVLIAAVTSAFLAGVSSIIGFLLSAENSDIDNILTSRCGPGRGEGGGCKAQV